MNQVMLDGRQGNSKPATGLIETDYSLMPENRSHFLNGPNGLGLHENLCEIESKVDGLSQEHSRSHRSENANVLRTGHSQKPLAIDLFTGLHGWAEGLIAEGWRVIGFDLEDMCDQFNIACHHDIQLVLQDVLTLHGRQFKDAALIVASPPCQEYSYMAMPWSRAKAIAAEYRTGVRDVKKLTALFDACFRIQREACEAAGRHIPMVVENVRGAIPWVGRSRWNFGSFHLWGDVPALMPMVIRKPMKNTGGSWFQPPDGRHCYAKNCPDGRATMRDENGIKNARNLWSDGADSLSATTGSKSLARKAASAMIAKIPEPLARHIARTFKPHADAA